mgnify:CR=1 FL=1
MGNTCAAPRINGTNTPHRNIQQKSRNHCRPSQTPKEAVQIPKVNLTDEERCKHADDNSQSLVPQKGHKSKFYATENQYEREVNENRQKPYHNEDIYIG